MESISDQSRHAEGMLLKDLTNVPGPQTEETNLGSARQALPSSTLQPLGTTSPADRNGKTTSTHSHRWITTLGIIAGRTTLMALYGITFAGAFSLINEYVGLGALVIAAFFCGGMMLFEFVYLLRNSRRL